MDGLVLWVGLRILRFLSEGYNAEDFEAFALVLLLYVLNRFCHVAIIKIDILGWDPVDDDAISGFLDLHSFICGAPFFVLQVICIIWCTALDSDVAAFELLDPLNRWLWFRLSRSVDGCLELFYDFFVSCHC